MNEIVDGEKLSEEIFKWYSQTESALTTAIWNNLNELIARCRLPLQDPSRIEVAIGEAEKYAHPGLDVCKRSAERLKTLRWVLCQISDKDFGLETKKEEL